MKRRISLSLIVAACLVLMLASIGSAQQPTRRIRFKLGATTASVTGRLSGWNDKAPYVMRLRPGQTMNLSVEGKCEDCHASVGVDSPAGANDTVDADMCQCRVQVSNTAAGDYRITVSESRKAERGWKGTFTLKVEVQ